MRPMLDIASVGHKPKGQNETSNAQRPTLNEELSWRATEGAGKRRGNVGCYDLLGRFFW